MSGRGAGRLVQHSQAVVADAGGLLCCPAASSARHSVCLAPTPATVYIIKAFSPLFFSPEAQECFLLHL